MSASTFKGGLAPTGPSYADKAKLQMRRPTPDSDAVASSDDGGDDHTIPPLRSGQGPVHPPGRRPSSGWLQDIQPNRKFSLPSVSFAGAASNPATPAAELPQQSRPSTSAFPWNTNSFSTQQQSVRTSDKALPSPTHEGEDGIGFLLNQQGPTRKSVRSQSYSIGQADIENSPVGQFSSRLRTSLRHRPSKPSLLGEGLSQLREDEDDIESSNGSEQGVRLPPGYWEREQKQALLKQAAEHMARTRFRAASTTSPHGNPSMSHSDFAVDEADGHDHAESSLGPLTRRFSEHVVAGFGVGANRISPQLGHLGDGLASDPWVISPGQPSGLNDGLGRRHSFATYTAHTQAFQPSTLTYAEEDEEIDTQQAAAPEDEDELKVPFDPASYFTGHLPASRIINASAISAAHPDPIASQSAAPAPNPYTGPGPTSFGRPGRRLYVVTFKCSRADIYYIYDNTGLEIRAGDLVITEGDRGYDLGQVSHADITLPDAKRRKNEALDEHFRWLAMFSQYSMAGASEDPMLGALARALGYPNMNRATLTSMGGQQQDQEKDTKPRMIKRLAQDHEIAALRQKEGSEAKAKRLGASKALEHKLPMEILDAEWQADYRKLTLFYYAEHYVNFNPLITDVFKVFKIRIWMSAVNPASVINPAGTQIQPPSAIAPGAILPPANTAGQAALGVGFGNNTGLSIASSTRPEGRRPRSQLHPDEFHYQPPAVGGTHVQRMAAYGNAMVMAQDAQRAAAQQFAAQQYGMQPYGGQQYPTDAYGRYTPTNYGAFYPPATFSASPAFNHASSGPSYRGGYPASTSATYSTGYATASTAAYDPMLVASMGNLSFNH